MVEKNTNEEEMGTYIVTVTKENALYDYANPTPDMIDVEHIILSLSREHRFGNFLDEEWTVLQHVLLVEKLVQLNEGSIMERYAALHHDDFEAYGGDIPTPFKRLLKNYHEYEKRGLNAIGAAFSVTLNDLPKIVKECDRLAMYIESLFFNEVKPEWHDFTYETFGELPYRGKLLDHLNFLKNKGSANLRSNFLVKHNQLRNILGL